MKTFRVEDVELYIEKGVHGLYYGTSPNIKGLLVTGGTQEEVIDKTPNAILELREAKKPLDLPEGFYDPIGVPTYDDE